MIAKEILDMYKEKKDLVDNLDDENLKSLHQQSLNEHDPVLNYLVVNNLGLNVGDTDILLFEEGKKFVMGLELILQRKENNLINFGIEKKHFDFFNNNELKKIWTGLSNSNINNEIYGQLNPNEIISLYIGVDAFKKNKIESENNFDLTISKLIGYSFKEQSLRNKIVRVRNNSNNPLPYGPNQLIARMKLISLENKNDFLYSLNEPLLKNIWLPSEGSLTKNSEKKSYVNEIFNYVKRCYNANN